MNDASRLVWGLRAGLAVGFGAAALLGAPERVEACGGLFCSATNPVNQAAEQIIFSDNGDGTVTAVIQILYEGPPTKFAWVLPIPGNPEVGVSSTQALDALKGATNPVYQLNTVLDDSCFAGGGTGGGFAGGGSAGTFGARGGAGGAGGIPGVSLLASGAIGPYLYDTIALDPALADAADVAIDWLTANGYDVGDLGPDVLRPYLEDGLNLIAFKLDPKSGTGSIRPVMITYEASAPSIPIRPTAVAANDDMGVLVWLLSDKRGIPENYKALELNEALIDWFNASNNYEQVVSRAADEAAGQGFVTEFAGATNGPFNSFVSVFAPWQRDTWNAFQAAPHDDPRQMVQEATSNWGGFDGMDDALRLAVTLPDGVSIQDFKECMACYLGEPGVTFDSSVYLQKLYELVIRPLIRTQDLLDARPYLTRLYTTMSAREMTMDPVFSFNGDLADVSNFHSADRVVDCTGGLDPFASDTPWTVTLPQGVVRGTEVGVWPVELDSQPAALKILQFATEGQGDVVEDNSEKVADVLASFGGGATKPDAGVGPMVTAGRASVEPPDGGGRGGGSGGSGAGQGADDASATDDDQGCRVAGSGASDLTVLALALAAVLARRRRSAA